MLEKKYRIGVVCGAGMATSSVVAEKLKDELSKRGIEANIITVTAIDASSVAKDLDLIVTTTLLQSDLGVPIIRAISLLTGIGAEETIKKIVNTLHSLKKESK